MRILVFLPCLTLGGAERQGVLVARYLKDRGHDVEVWGFPPPRGSATLITELDQYGLSHTELPSWPGLDWEFSECSSVYWYSRGFYRWHKRLSVIAASIPCRKFDVIIPFTFWPSLMACLLQKRLRAHRIYWNHRGGYDNAGLFHNAFLVQQVLRHQPCFLANSRSGAKYLQDTFNLPSAQITVIPNAYVPGNEGSKLDLCPQPSTGGVLSLIQVANLFPEKDYDTLLRALQILNRKAPVCKLQLCGEFLKEADRARFVARVAELGIQKRTFHHGATTRDDVFRLLLDADVGVLSSKSEGQPNSVMEYMYVGLPVVGTRIPGIQELVGEENEEWLFDVGDADGLARVIERLRANPTLRTELGRRNHKRIIEHFAPGNVLPRWLELVEHD